MANATLSAIINRQVGNKWLDCAKLGVLYAKKLEQSPKALPLKIFGGQLFWNFLTHIGLKYKKFHLDDTF